MNTQAFKKTETWLVGFVTLVIMLAMFALTQTANAVMNEDEVRQWIESEFGVTVLGIRAISENGEPVLAVTIMNPAGDSNGAFLINTITVDPEAEKLVPQFRHGTSGVQLAAPPVSRRTAPFTRDTL